MPKTTESFENVSWLNYFLKKGSTKCPCYERLRKGGGGKPGGPPQLVGEGEDLEPQTDPDIPIPNSLGIGIVRIAPN